MQVPAGIAVSTHLCTSLTVRAQVRANVWDPVLLRSCCLRRQNECANRKGAEAANLGRRGEEAPALLRCFAQAAQMFDYGYAGAEQRSVNRTVAAIGAVDIERIDTDKRDPHAAQHFGKFRRQVRMTDVI